MIVISFAEIPAPAAAPAKATALDWVIVALAVCPWCDAVTRI
jgi:hypothetical protein